jgi:hypothetical protein
MPPLIVQLKKSVLDRGQIICQQCLQPFMEQ